jgi:hypothetical protein
MTITESIAIETAGTTEIDMKVRFHMGVGTMTPTGARMKVGEIRRIRTMMAGGLREAIEAAAIGGTITMVLAMILIERGEVLLKDCEFASCFPPSTRRPGTHPTALWDSFDLKLHSPA